MNRYKKLVNNSLIFAVGNMGSKLMQFIMIPIYSYALTTGEFGKADFLTTLVSLLSPLICLDMIDGVFRFSLDNNNNKSKIFSTGLVFTSFISLIVLILGLLMNSKVVGYPVIETVWLLIVTTFFGLISNYARAVGHIKKYAISGVVNTFSMGIYNVISLVFLHLGVSAYINAITFGQTMAIIYLVTTTSIMKNIKFTGFDISLFRKMVIYSVPLIPNTFAWWLNSASDRFFILAMLGASANGIYSMINRLPSMISTLMNIFSQSWQISAVEEFNSNDSKDFISNVFEYIISMVFFMSMLLLIIIKPLINVILSMSYHSGWKLVPFMLVAVIYMILSSFLGVLYTASKKTIDVFISTMLGAIVNVILTILFIKLVGISGAAMANAISFFVVFLYRFHFMKEMRKVNLNIKKFLVLHLLFSVVSVELFFIKNQFLFIIAGVLTFFIQFLLDQELQKIVKSFLISIKKLKCN